MGFSGLGPLGLASPWIMDLACIKDIILHKVKFQVASWASILPILKESR